MVRALSRPKVQLITRGKLSYLTVIICSHALVTYTPTGKQCNVMLLPSHSQITTLHVAVKTIPRKDKSEPTLSHIMRLRCHNYQLIHQSERTTETWCRSMQLNALNITEKGYLERVGAIRKSYIKIARQQREDRDERMINKRMVLQIEKKIGKTLHGEIASRKESCE